MQKWLPESWRQCEYSQQAKYPDESKLLQVVKQLSQMPPLVTHMEVETLKTQLADAQAGHQFILQGGDCAESFDNINDHEITAKLKILLQMSLILIHGLRKPIIRVGRIAGQYAKPRSSDTETQQDTTLPSYRGDLVNSREFDAKHRQPNPHRLLAGYNNAATTLNYIRALVDGGFANLQHPEMWNLDFVEHSIRSDDYHAIVNAIADALDFLNVFDGLRSSSLDRIEFYTSHEALHLDYEQALTRQFDDKWYNLSTHFPWIGMRTGQLKGAHVEYLRGIENPIGIKVGPSADTTWLQNIIKALNPKNQSGKLMLISRLGVGGVKKHLPDLIKASQDTGVQLLWSCDPMHGNTQTTDSGVKTRDFDDIITELQHTFETHHQLQSHLSGVHFELTGDNVTECIGGARGLNKADLDRAYKSLVDPRLNYEQSLEMAMLIAGQAKSGKSKKA